MIGVASYTPAGLTFDEATHRYRLGGAEFVSVTGALKLAGLVDLGFATEAARALGEEVHAAISLYMDGVRFKGSALPADVAVHLAAYRRFLAESGFRVDASEERLADVSLGAAGTLDLRGAFVGDVLDTVDVIDVKTGEIPPWVGYQTAGYARLLPFAVRRRVRRFVLQLRPDTTYRLVPLTGRSDEAVFLAAVTIARAKRGLL